MIKKYVEVTDITFGQLYDAVAKGEEFYVQDEKIYLSSVTGMLETETLNCQGVYFEFSESKIKKAKPWKEQLDGSYENGIWCMCNRTPNSNDIGFVKVIEECPINVYVDHVGDHWSKAAPLPKDLADQLEALSKR